MEEVKKRQAATITRSDVVSHNDHYKPLHQALEKS